VKDLGFSVTVSGDKEVFAALGRLPANLQKKVLKRAAREAMKPALAVARKNAPKGKTGNLRSSLKSKVMKSKKGRVGQLIATHSGWFKGTHFYGAFQEFGWHVGKRSSSLRSRGKWSGIGTADDNRKFIEGKHFVERTFDEQKAGIARTFVMLVKRYVETGLPQDKRGAHLRSGGGKA
jgi:HK97 gp10 family phage protein